MRLRPLLRCFGYPHFAVLCLAISLMVHVWVLHEWRLLADHRLRLLVYALERIDCDLIDCSVLPKGFPANPAQ